MYIRVFYKDKDHPDVKTIPRCDIWKYLALVGTKAEACTRYLYLLNYKVTHTVQVVLHAFTEARTEGLKNYHPLFKEDGNLSISYVNKYINTVYISLHSTHFAHVRFVLCDTLFSVCGNGAIGKEARISHRNPYGYISKHGYKDLIGNNLHRKAVRILDATGKSENIEEWAGWLAELRRVGEVCVIERLNLYVFLKSGHKNVMDMNSLRE